MIENTGAGKALAVWREKEEEEGEEPRGKIWKYGKIDTKT